MKIIYITLLLLKPSRQIVSILISSDKRGDELAHIKEMPPGNLIRTAHYDSLLREDNLWSTHIRSKYS